MVIAAAIYGKYWSGQLVQFLVAVAHILKATYSQESQLMHLIRVLVFLASNFKFWLTVSHISGANNPLADALSRNNVALCFVTGSSYPAGVMQYPTSIGRSTSRKHHLDIHSLDEAVQGYFAAALALATHKTYKVA